LPQYVIVNDVESAKYHSPPVDVFEETCCCSCLKSADNGANVIPEFEALGIDVAPAGSNPPRKYNH
jgi:hypothetical protein